MIKSKEEFLGDTLCMGAGLVSGSNSLGDLREVIESGSGLNIKEIGHRVVDLDNVILPDIFKVKEFTYNEQELVESCKLIEACIVANTLSDSYGPEEDILNEKIELLNDQLEFSGRGFKDDSDSTRLKAFELLEFMEAVLTIDTENEVFLGWIPNTKHCIITNIELTDMSDDGVDSK